MQKRCKTKNVMLYVDLCCFLWDERVNCLWAVLCVPVWTKQKPLHLPFSEFYVIGVLRLQHTFSSDLLSHQSNGRLSFARKIVANLTIVCLRYAGALTPSRILTCLMQQVLKKALLSTGKHKAQRRLTPAAIFSKSWAFRFLTATTSIPNLVFRRMSQSGRNFVRVRQPTNTSRQARRQDLAAGGPETRRGGTFFNYSIGCMLQLVGQMWHGGHRFQMGGRAPLALSWRRPCI